MSANLQIDNGRNADLPVRILESRATQPISHSQGGYLRHDRPGGLRHAGIMLTAGLLGILSMCLVEAQSAPINPPAGNWIGYPPDSLPVQGFRNGDRVVFTPFFYWYDVWSGLHMKNPDGTDALTTHPVSLTGFSFRSGQWHRKQLRDMIDAGIDVVLPVYWGAPSERSPGRDDHWSYAGLRKLVEAREELLREGFQPPTIGMFYDTTTLQYNSWNESIDLTTSYGRRWFYESIRDFFSLIPPRHWAMMEGQPIVFLYRSNFAADYDSGILSYLRESFESNFGGARPYIVRESSWILDTEKVYSWGGALGLKNPGVASLGPGYDQSAVPGRKPLVIHRENGRFFESQWIRFLRHPSDWVFIETWNEFHEGSDIADSREQGRTYIELNRRFVELFKSGFKPATSPVQLEYQWDPSNQKLVFNTESREDSSLILETSTDLTHWISIRKLNKASSPMEWEAPFRHREPKRFFRLQRISE